MNTLACPHCGKTIEITEALTHQIEAKVLEEERLKHQKELEKARNEAGTKLQEEMKLLRDEMARKDKKLEEARQAELEIRKQKNLLEEEKRAFELDKQRQLDAEREKIRQKTTEEILEQQRLKDKEYELKIEGLKKALEDAQRKASQGSQQTQGEVAELDLEQLLRTNFPGDSIEPVGKGALGADIRQVVRSPRGLDCGSILWESKRTKAWSDTWIAKLKDDMRSAKANVPAIISEVLPDDISNGLGLKDGVWVANRVLALPLALLLRKSLLDAARQKLISENKQSKAEQLYTYITSHEFAQQVEAMVEVYLEMKDQITKERTAFERSWKQREAQVGKLLSGVAGVYGSMQGIAGTALPSIRPLELASGEEE